MDREPNVRSWPIPAVVCIRPARQLSIHKLPNPATCQTAWTIEEAAKRDQTRSALDAMEPVRCSPVSETRPQGGTRFLERQQIETEATPIRYVAELIGADSDSERAIRWLIVLMVLCCDGDRADGRGFGTAINHV